MKKEILIIGVMLLGIVAVSGCTNSGVTDKAYNGSYMSFQYPEGFKVAETNAGRTVAVVGNGNILINQYSNIENQKMFVNDLGVKENIINHPDPFNYTTGLTNMEDEAMYFTREGKYYVITYPPALRDKVVGLARSIRNNQ